MATGLMGALLGLNPVTAPGAVATKNLIDKNTKKEEDKPVLGEGLLDKEPAKEEETPKEAKPRKLSKDEEMDLMLDLSMGGLDTRQINKIMKAGSISEEELNALDNETRAKVEKIYGTEKKSSDTTMPEPEETKPKSTVLPKGEEKTSSKTTMPEEKKEKNSNTTIDTDTGLDFPSRTEFPEVTDEGWERLINFVKGSDGTKNEPSPRKIVDWMMNHEGRKFLKEHPNLTDEELFEILLRASQHNAAYNARQVIRESEYPVGHAEAAKNAKDDAIKTRARMAEKEDQRLKESGLNKYLKKDKKD